MKKREPLDRPITNADRRRLRLPHLLTDDDRKVFELVIRSVKSGGR